MQELLAQFLLALRGAWRYRWPALALSWVIALVGWIIVATIPDQFEASARVQINPESVLKPLLAGIAVDSDPRNQASQVQSAITSYANLDRVARETDLYLTAPSSRDQERVTDGLAERIQIEAAKPTTVSPTRRPRTQPESEFTITYTDTNPKTAFRVVSSLTNGFMEGSVGNSKADVGRAQDFLNAQLKDYEEKLRDSESKLAEFKKENVGLMPGQEQGDYYQRLDTAMTQLETLKARYKQVDERRKELERQINGEEPTFGLSGPVGGSPIDAQIASYQARIDQLLVQYTDKHPEVVALRDTIARLQAEKNKGAKVSSTVAPPDGGSVTGDQMLIRSLDMNPVYQNLKISLSQAEAELAELRGQISAQDQTVANLRGRVDAIPEVEAQLARLTRDSDVNRKQYDELLTRVEQAKISQQAASKFGDNFRVVEPPRVPLIPSGPQRALMNSVVMLMSLAAGLALAFFLQQVRPVFSTKDAVRQATGLPVIGSVSAAIVESFVPWYRRQSALLSGALLALLTVFLLNLLLQDSVRAAVRGIVG